jgi:hypothetical protein
MGQEIDIILSGLNLLNGSSENNIDWQHLAGQSTATDATHGAILLTNEHWIQRMAARAAHLLTNSG